MEPEETAAQYIYAAGAWPVAYLTSMVSGVAFANANRRQVRADMRHNSAEGTASREWLRKLDLGDRHLFG